MRGKHIIIRICTLGSYHVIFGLYMRTARYRPHILEESSALSAPYKQIISKKTVDQYQIKN